MKPCYNTSMKIIIGVGFALAVSFSVSAATTYYVSATDGDDANDGTSWDSPLKTLNAFTGEAPEKSLQGNTIILSKGTYKISAPIYMNGLSSFRGNTGNPEDVIVDGQGQTPVFYMAYASGNQMGTVYNLTVQGGYLDSANMPSFRAFSGGAGVFMGNDDRNVVSNCIIRDCHVKISTTMQMYGGGLYCNDGKIFDVVVSNCTISADANKAYGYGGGAYIAGRAIPDGLFVSNCQAVVLSGSEALGYGGGLCSVAPGKVSRTRIVGCQAQRGGGVCFNRAGNYKNYFVTACSATTYGGGIMLGVADITLAASAVTNCSATSGGGLYLSSNNAMLTNCLVVANTATGNGGGIYCENGKSNISIVDSVLRGNTAVRSGVVQFGSYRFNTASICRCVIEDNEATDEGGLASVSSCYNSKLWDCIVTGNKGKMILRHEVNPSEYSAVSDVKEWWIRNCYIARNNTTYLMLFKLSNVPSRGTYSIVDHCTIVDNNTAADCTDKYVFSAHGGWGTAAYGTNNYVSANVIYGNGNGGGKNFNLASQDLMPNVKHNYTDGVPMESQNNYDPSVLPSADQFEDAANGDWRLKQGSALVDQNTTAICDCSWMTGKGVTDIGDGTYTLEPIDDYGVHVVFNNAKKRWIGDYPDIGCFEFRPIPGLMLLLK